MYNSLEGFTYGPSPVHHWDGHVLFIQLTFKLLRRSLSLPQSDYNSCLLRERGDTHICGRWDLCLCQISSIWLSLFTDLLPALMLGHTLLGRTSSAVLSPILILYLDDDENRGTYTVIHNQGTGEWHLRIMHSVKRKKIPDERTVGPILMREGD